MDIPSRRRIDVVSEASARSLPRSREDVMRGVGVGVQASAGESAAATDDVELVARVALGDAEALTALYDRYAAMVHGLTSAVLWDAHLAEEATHDVFLGLWQRPRAYDPARGSFAGWLLRIARNRAIDLLRRRREQPFVFTAGEEGEVDPVTWLIDPDPDPAEQAMTRALRREVRSALAALSPDHRLVLEMAYYGGMTQREIAAALDRPLGTVKSQVRTAMQRMATELANDDDRAAAMRANGRAGAPES